METAIHIASKALPARMDDLLRSWLPSKIRYGSWSMPRLHTLYYGSKDSSTALALSFQLHYLLYSL